MATVTAELQKGFKAFWLTYGSLIQTVFNNENDIPQAKLAAFAEALNTTTADLMGFKNVKPVQEVSANTVTCTISKGKPQLEELIKKLDRLGEKDLNRVLSVVKPLIENFVADDDD